MREERRKEPRVRRRVRLTLTAPGRRVGGVSTNLSERGIAVSLDARLEVGTRVVVTALLPGGQVSFDAVVRHAGRGADGSNRVGVEITETAPAAYRRLVRDELQMLFARSGAGLGADPDVPAATLPRSGRQRGIPSPVALRAQSAPAAAATPAAPAARRRSPPAQPIPIGRLRPAAAKSRRSTPRGGAVRPRTPSRGAQAAASPLARLEPGLHGIATARLAAGQDVDALAAAAAVRDAVGNALDGLLPAGARLSIVALELELEPGAEEEGGGSLAAAVRLEEVDRRNATARFVTEVSRRNRTVGSGRVTVRIAG